MAVIIGMKQRAKTYQLLQEKNNNYYQINNEISSNLLYLNTETNAYNDATINFKNNFQFGYINNKMSINNSSNLLSIDNTSIDLYKNTYIHSNLNVDNYLYTSNNTTYFNNNIDITLNNPLNSFKINLNNSVNPIASINKNEANFNTNIICSNNITIKERGTLYTNFIDSPNLEPVVIKNMQFAESLRILTANIIQNISIDNDIIFSNLTDFYKPGVPNSLTNIPADALLWNTYMINNNINKTDPWFSRPNINVIKYVDNDIINNKVIGGSNILEFRTAKLATGNIKTKVYAINNNGYMCIGEDNNKDIPLKINITPPSSNIIQYTNINNINKSFSITSNGFVNIGSINHTNNQLNIIKNNNENLANTDLISLNINNINYTSTIGQINIPFKINDNINEIIFNFSYSSPILGVIPITITITNSFIQNNIISMNSSIYEDATYYNINNDYLTNNGSSSNFTENIKNIIRSPLNTFNIDSNGERIGDTFKFHIYKFQTVKPIITSVNHYKIIYNYNLYSTRIITYEFYIHKNLNNNYNYSYNGTYIPVKTNFITASSNNITTFSMSEYGNIGIGTNYTDIYNIYTSSALINDINCKTINNPLTKNISYNYCSLNNINAINNASSISTDLLVATSNFTSNFSNINTIINSNLNVLGNNGTVRINTKTIFGNGDQVNGYNITINTSNYNGKGIVIKNDNDNINPSFLIYSTGSNSYPLLTLDNISASYKVSINSNNNFEISNTKNGAILFSNNSQLTSENNLNNSVSILNNSFVIFEDSNSNVKIFLGKRITNSIEWYDAIDDTIGFNNSIDDSINMYGNLNFRRTDNTHIINTYTNNNKLKMGFGASNISTEGLYIDLSTIITSNLTAKKDIYLEGTILTTSDSNLKSNIIKIHNPLNKINNISGYTYIRTDTSNYETGLLAQEVKNILPEVVKYENNHYNIAYGNMSGLFVECIKELNKKIDILTEKLELLKV
jgi:hypothetical protein